MVDKPSESAESNLVKASKGTVQQVNLGGVSFGQDNTVNVGGDVIGTLYGLKFEEVMTLVRTLKEGEEEISYSGRPPYLGLEAYQEGDADLFFGREQLTADLVELLRSIRF